MEKYKVNKTVTRILLSIIILIVGSVLYELFANIDKGLIRIWDLQEFLGWTARGLPSLLVVLLIGHFPIYFKKPFWGIGISFAIAFLLYMGVRETGQETGLSANIGTLFIQGGIPSLIILLWSGKTFKKSGLSINEKKTNISQGVELNIVSSTVKDNNDKSNNNKHLLFPKAKIFYVVLASLVLTLSGSFYWYELRPAKIRQECSWVKHTNESIPAKPAMSEEELKTNSLLEDCKRYNVVSPTTGYKSIFGEDFRDDCERKNRQVIEDYKSARPAVPAKYWYSKASEKQYDFCIKSKGLTR